MLPIFLHSFISCNTKYLSTTFLSTVTSPKGYQLDIWLLILLIMDCVPMFMSLYHTVQYIAQSHSDSWRYDPNSVFWSLTSAMRLVYINILLAKYKNIPRYYIKFCFTFRSWSPAYQLNTIIMQYVDGCLIKHMYILVMFTLTVTQLHRWIVSNLYCIRL